MRLLTRTHNRTCQCPLEMVELLDGQHLEQCRPNRIGRRRFLIGPRQHLAPSPPVPAQSKHCVYGFYMPRVFTPPVGGVDKSPVKLLNHNFTHCCLDHAWCDVSSDGGGGFVARRWPELRLCATAMRDASCWVWHIRDLSAGNGDEDVVATGREADLETVLLGVGSFIEDVELRRVNSTSWALHDLRDEML